MNGSEDASLERKYLLPKEEVKEVVHFVKVPKFEYIQ